MAFERNKVCVKIHMISAQHYKFPHELKKTRATKIPKYKVKYSKKKKNALATVATQTPGPEVGTQTDGQLLGEAPARVYSINTYSPLVPSPSSIYATPTSITSSTTSPSVYASPTTIASSTTPTSQISPVPSEIQQILDTYPAPISPSVYGTPTTIAASPSATPSVYGTPTSIAASPAATPSVYGTPTSIAASTPPQQLYPSLPSAGSDMSVDYATLGQSLGQWNGEGMPVFQRPNRPPPIIIPNPNTDFRFTNYRSPTAIIPSASTQSVIASAITPSPIASNQTAQTIERRLNELALETPTPDSSTWSPNPVIRIREYWPPFSPPPGWQFPSPSSPADTVVEYHHPADQPIFNRRDSGVSPTGSVDTLLNFDRSLLPPPLARPVSGRGFTRSGSPLESTRPGTAPTPMRPILSIDTNVPRRRGPRAPTTPNQPEPDRSQITAANIVGGRRRRRQTR